MHWAGRERLQIATEREGYRNCRLSVSSSFHVPARQCSTTRYGRLGQVSKCRAAYSAAFARDAWSPDFDVERWKTQAVPASWPGTRWWESAHVSVPPANGQTVRVECTLACQGAAVHSRNVHHVGNPPDNVWLMDAEPVHPAPSLPYFAAAWCGLTLRRKPAIATRAARTEKAMPRSRGRAGEATCNPNAADERRI